MNFLGSLGGVGGARGLLELSSRWWRGELGMGSRRLGGVGGGGGGCPLPVPTTPTPTPATSRALRLGELLNLLAAAFSLFFFCYTETNKRRGGASGSKQGATGRFKAKIMRKMEGKEGRSRRALEVVNERQEEQRANVIVLKLIGAEVWRRLQESQKAA